MDDPAMKQFLVGWIALAGIAGPVCAGAAADHGLWIENVTVVSPERDQPLPRATVKIQNERIVQIVQSPAGKRPPGTEVIDAHGLFLTPGLIDGHVHLREIPGMLPDQERAHPDIALAAREQFPKSYLYFGFTTLVDLASSREALAPWNAQALHPDTYFCGGVPVMDISAAQLFRALTIADAEAFGISEDIGTVQVGKRANLLLLNADPTQTIHAYDKIEKVILAGRLIDPDTLAADR
jgi:imidazolonepropionase-like amidohydrolase